MWNFRRSRRPRQVTATKLRFEQLESRLLLSLSPSVVPSFLAASGTVIRNDDGAGSPVLLQGTNVEILFPENWMMPMDSSGQLGSAYADYMALYNRFGQAETNSLLTTLEQAWLTPQDFVNMKSLGINCIRVPFWWTTVENENGTWRTDAFTEMDWIVNEAWSQGIYTVFDMHGAPGDPSLANLSQGQDNTSWWTNSTDIQETVTIWQNIAAHYAGNPAVAGYDLLNEPSPPSTALAWSVYNTLYQGIRAVDPDHMIVIEDTFDSWDLNMLPDPASEGWTNVMYEAHDYAWGYTSAAQPIAGSAGEVSDFQAHYSWDVPFWVGEFNDFQYSSAWDQTIQQFQAANVNWCMWNYKIDGNSSWGLVDTPGATPPEPNLLTDSAATIASDWSQWTTSNPDFQLQSSFFAGLNVNVRNQFADNVVNGLAQNGAAAYDPVNGQQWTVSDQGSGSTVGGSSDQFNLAAEPSSGNSTLVAEVNSFSATDPTAQAGVMFRNDATPGAEMAALVETPSQGLEFLWRTVAGGAAGSVQVAGVSGPVWLEITRVGNVFTAYYSLDDVNWIQVGSSQTIAMSTTAQAGMAVAAGSSGAACTATFSGEALNPVTAPQIIQWQSAENDGNGLGQVALTMPSSGTFIEDRAGGIQTLLVAFNSPINAATFTPATVSMAGNNAQGAVNLSGITVTTSMLNGTVGEVQFSQALPDAARYLVQVAGVAGTNGLTLAATDCSFSALEGDVTGDGQVNTADLLAADANYARTVSPANTAEVRADVSMDGSVNATDLALISSDWNHSLLSVPFPVVASLAAANAAAQAASPGLAATAAAVRPGPRALPAATAIVEKKPSPIRWTPFLPPANSLVWWN